MLPKECSLNYGEFCDVKFYADLYTGVKTSISVLISCFKLVLMVVLHNLLC